MANILTISRLVLSPFFILFFLTGILGRETDNTTLMWVGQILALVIAVLFEATDICDGYIARKYKQVTEFGKLVDPLADSISRFTAFLCFLAAGYASIWAVALVFYRDATVASLRGMAAKKGFVMAARASGKIKAIIQGTVIITICSLDVIKSAVKPELNVPHVANLLMWVVTGVTLWSLIDYLWGGRKFLKEIIKG
ncbi:CDP-diacylglycerol--glycerol-3-phosphate 3-phosphatidyltransferase [Planctomycetota bacterium]